MTPKQLPAAARNFAGRAAAVRMLAGLTRLTAGSRETSVISVIDGTAGVGKTALALHVAHQIADKFPDGQLYANLRGFDPAGPPEPAAAAIRLLLDALAVPADEMPADTEAQATLYQRLLAGKRMLVLLDNAHDADQVRPLLPAGPGCLVLVTSRQRLTGLISAGAHPLTLDVLDGGEAADLLTRHLGAERLAGEPRAVTDLIELCARLPLALSICAALVASQPEVSLAALAERLRDTHGRLDVLAARPAAANLRAVFCCSYQQLDQGAARLFRLLGLRAGPDISAAAATSLAGLPSADGRRLLGELTRAHLLTAHAGRYSCHGLLRAYAAELAEETDSEADQRAATGRMLDHYTHTAAAAALRLHPKRNPVSLGALRPGVTLEQIGDAGQALAWFQAERQVLIAAVGRAADDRFDTQAWQLTWALSRFLDIQGRWDDWAAIEKIALAATRRLGDRAAQAASHQRLGHASIRLGNYPEGNAQLKLALAIHTERGDRAGQAYVHNTMAIALNSHGRYREALDHAEQALAAYTTAGDLPGKALALNSVGWFHAVLGDHQQALSYCGQALDLFGQLGHREGVANALDSLGYAHQRLGNYTGATACYEQALGLHRELGSRWGVAETLGHLGDTKDAAGNPAEARAAWAEALTILEDLRHPGASQLRAKLRPASSAFLSERPALLGADTERMVTMPRLATADRVERSALLEFIRPRHRAVVITTRADGRPQSSPVTCGVDQAGRIVVASYPARAKIRNARRDPRVSCCVLSDDWDDPYVHLDGTAEVLDMPDALDGLVEYYRCIAGEHPDWDEYRAAMARQGKSLLRISIDHWGPIATGGFPPGTDA